MGRTDASTKLTKVYIHLYFNHWGYTVIPQIKEKNKHLYKRITQPPLNLLAQPRITQPPLNLCNPLIRNLSGFSPRGFPDDNIIVSCYFLFHPKFKPRSQPPWYSNTASLSLTSISSLVETRPQNSLRLRVVPLHGNL